MKQAQHIDTAEALVNAARRLSIETEKLRFKLPVSHVYNPLQYAWEAHEQYLRKFGPGQKRVVFVGMNPGPFGMAQTGVPFGEIAAVRDWMGIQAAIHRPACEHPKRPVLGFECHRSEVSGRRLWKLFADRFGTSAAFFASHLVVNYCPLCFCSATGANLTPDKLPKSESSALFRLCDEHLLAVVRVVQPEWLIGIGAFAVQRAQNATDGTAVRIGQILHPSPASPAANRDWANIATRQLIALGVWNENRRGGGTAA